MDVAVGLRVPVANLRPSLEATRAAWQRNLDALYERCQFILGEQVQAFEQEFALALGAGYAVGVGSGTAALEICLRHAGITHAGQHVLTSALSAPVTAVAIRAAGATPVFADVNPATLQIDPADAAARVTSETAAIVPVHLYGDACALDRFAALAAGTGAALIQDACQAHGADFSSKPFTSFSPYVAYSFYPTKNLGCLGDGGAILTSDEEIATRLRLLRDGGRTGQVSFVGGAVNSRLDEMQACYLRAFLPHLAEWNEHRRIIARIYDEALAGCDAVRPVTRSPSSVVHLYVIRAEERDRLRDHLATQKIGTAVHYPVPLHLHPAFACAGVGPGDLPHAEQACREILSLPVWPYMPREDALFVAGEIRRFYGR